MKWIFHTVACGGFWIAMTYIHITYSASSYWKNVILHDVVLFFHIGIWRNKLQIPISHPPCCPQTSWLSTAVLSTISWEIVFSILIITMRRRWRTHIRFMVSVRARIVRDHLVGPYLLPDRLTSADYLIFFEQVLSELHNYWHVSIAAYSSL